MSYKNAQDSVQIAGIIARNSDGFANCTSIENCYYLIDKSTVASYNYNGSSYSAYTENRKTTSEMQNRNFIISLKEAYIQDEQKTDGTWKYNNGYPILSWQKSYYFI